MTTTTTTTETDTTESTRYLPGEAFTALMTAREWMTRFDTDTLLGMYDIEAGDPTDPDCSVDVNIAAITGLGHADARRLNLPISPAGRYPPVIWEHISDRDYA